MTPDTLVLIKGSRAARMELVLNALCGDDSD
jgi:UDP-N-acetylmuramyl pentapeptide synthase